MAIELFATVADMERRLGVPPGSITGAELVRAESALSDASALALTIGNPRWTAATVPPGVAAMVLAAALRVVRNPDGYTSENVGDYSWQLPQTATGITYTPAEVAVIEAAAGTAGRGHRVYSVRTPSGYASPTPAPGAIVWELP